MLPPVPKPAAVAKPKALFDDDDDDDDGGFGAAPAKPAAGPSKPKLVLDEDDDDGDIAPKAAVRFIVRHIISGPTDAFLYISPLR